MAKQSISRPPRSLILTIFLRVNKRPKNNSPDYPFLSLFLLWRLQPVPYFGKPDEPCHLVDFNKKHISELITNSAGGISKEGGPGSDVQFAVLVWSWVLIQSK